MFDEIVDTAEYSIMLEEIRKEFGEDVFALVDLLAHGLTKKAASRALNRPYPEVRAQVLKLRKFLTKFYSSRYETVRG